METDLQFLIPLRNPTDVLTKSIASLVTQSEKNFEVIISDNHSTSGQEFIEAALAALQEGSLAVKIVRPGRELGRVEHWNWLHYQATADWLKPLFVGDWLD